MPTTDTTVSRLQLAHPDLGHDGGTLLHDKVRAAWTKIGDNMSSRYFTASTVADSTTTTFGHNFGIEFSEFTVFVFTGTYPNLTLVEDPVSAGWTIAATTGMEKLEIDVTTPASGGPHDFAVFVIQGGGGGGGLEVEQVSFPITALPNKHYLVDTSGGAFTVTLPPLQAGAVIRFTDTVGEWGTNNLIVQGNGADQIRLNDSKIDNELFADVPESWFQLMSNGSEWVVDNPFTPSPKDFTGSISVGGDINVTGSLNADQASASDGVSSIQLTNGVRVEQETLVSVSGSNAIDLNSASIFRYTASGGGNNDIDVFNNGTNGHIFVVTKVAGAGTLRVVTLGGTITVSTNQGSWFFYDAVSLGIRPLVSP